jgi:hypothetical protein
VRPERAIGSTGIRTSDDIVAIRGPPQSFDDAVDDAPGEQFDGVDDHAEVDWAA